MSDDMAEEYLGILESFLPLVEAAGGYRSRAEGTGFSPTVAEAMAYSWHDHMLRKMFHDIMCPDASSQD